MFCIETRNGKKWSVTHEGHDAEEAARIIENWKSNFIDLKPTRYGFRLTLDFLKNMVEGEIALFEEANEAMRVTA